MFTESVSVAHSDIPVMYPKAVINDKLQAKINNYPDERTKVLEVVSKIILRKMKKHISFMLLKQKQRA